MMITFSQKAKFTLFSLASLIASRPLVSPGSLQTFWHDDNLFVTWADPEEINIPLMGYKLTWGPVGTPLSQTALRAVPFGTNIYMISGLDSEKDYLVLVWCYSNGGDGPASSIRTTESTSKLKVLLLQAVCTWTYMHIYMYM